MRGREKGRRGPPEIRDALPRQGLLRGVGLRRRPRLQDDREDAVPEGHADLVLRAGRLDLHADRALHAVTGDLDPLDVGQLDRLRAVEVECPAAGLRGLLAVGDADLVANLRYDHQGHVGRRELLDELPEQAAHHLGLAGAIGAIGDVGLLLGPVTGYVLAGLAINLVLEVLLLGAKISRLVREKQAIGEGYWENP